MKKLAIFCMLAFVACCGTLTAETIEKPVIPAEYELASTLPANLAAQLAAYQQSLEAELESIQAEIAADKADGIYNEQLQVRLLELRNELGMTAPVFKHRGMASSLDEGGESCTSALPITGLPFTDTGNTCDNADDDTPFCSGDIGTDNDVVYSFTPVTDIEIQITTCLPGTDFDTVLKIRDSQGNLIACNDDFSAGDACVLPAGPSWRSTITCVQLSADERYCIYVDGYPWRGDDTWDGLHCGNYEILIEECGCAFCPLGAKDEGEPVCQTGYFDTYNSGCNNVTNNGNQFPAWGGPLLECGDVVCGTAGNYSLADGSPARDTDWYLISVPAPTVLRWCVEAEFAPFIAIIDLTLGCALNLPILDFADGNNCTEVCVEACVPAGRYALFVAPEQIAGSVPCGSDYVGRVECEPCDPQPPCIPDPPALFVNPAVISLPFYACLDICPGVPTLICIGPDLGPEQFPVGTILSGCSPDETGCEETCPPAIHVGTDIFYDRRSGSWYFRIAAAPGTGSGCVCFCLEDILPVELNNFDAIAGDRSVTLNWSTASETDNDHFDIQRDGAVVARVDATGSSSGGNYSWTETGLTNGREYTYDLIAVDVMGGREVVATTSATPTMKQATVNEYALHQNYPNPFNPETNILFDLAEAGKVTLTVYNSLGQSVTTLVSSSLEAGRHEVSFDGSNLTSGLYFYRLEAGDFTAIRKMILMK